MNLFKLHVLCNWFAEHMLFMGSEEFPDENEVCLAFWLAMHLKLSYLFMSIWKVGPDACVKLNDYVEYICFDFSRMV